MYRNKRQKFIFALVVLALISGLKFSVAQSLLLWSNNPCAFEQHLLRRYNNPLFPKDRRIVTQAEIDKAHYRDIKDYEKCNQKLIKLAEDISRLPERVDSSTINDFRERIDDLIQDAMGVGGKAYNIASKTKEIRTVLLESWAQSVSNNPEANRALQLAEAFYHKNAPKFEIPFLAQMVRENGPIPASEVIPALLMEETKTIKMIVAWIEPNKRPLIQKEAVAVLRSAIKDGGTFDNLNEILTALGVSD